MQEMSKNSLLSIFILGTTGVGKTKLSLDLSKYFNAEIVSTDSKQLYKYANIMTAKSTDEELKQCNHHMINALELHQTSFNRNLYYNQVKQIVRNSIWSQKKSAIFIGGTNYYVETILFEIDNLQTLKNRDESNNQKDNTKKQNKIQQKQQDLTQEQRLQSLSSIANMSRQQKYSRLKQVDPLMAQKLHPNDQIRINSFLTRYYKTLVPPSTNYKPYSLRLNNPETILFWIRNSNKQQHRSIVEERIKKMLNKQGIVEILSVYLYLDDYYERNDKDESKKQQSESEEQKSLEINKLKKQLTFSGIGQSIGYKEFFQFYHHFKNQLKIHLKQNENHQSNILVNNTSKQPLKYPQINELITRNYEYFLENKIISLSLLETGETQLIKDTHSYCKRQITWIRNRIFCKNDETLRKFYILDLSEDNGLKQQKKDEADQMSLLQRYDKYVKTRAINIIESLLKKGYQQTYTQYQHHEQEFTTSKNTEQPNENPLLNWKKYKCESCQNFEANGLHEWQQHLRSKRHIKRLKYLQKKDDIDKWIMYRKQKEAKQKQQNQ